MSIAGCNMVWRSIPLSVAQKQLLVGCREQLRIKDSEFESKVLHCFKTANWNKKKVVLNCKKMFLFEKIDKNVLYNSLFLGNSWKFCVRVRQGAFLSEDWKRYPPEAVSSLQFFASEMCERKAYRKQTGSNVSVLLSKVSALEYDRFKQVSLYTFHDYLQILKSKS